MMNNEEFDRKVEFIVNQQDKFEVDIERLREALPAEPSATRPCWNRTLRIVDRVRLCDIGRR